MGKSKVKDPGIGVGDPDRWLSLGIRDASLFKKLVERYQFDASKLREKVRDIQHRITIRSVRVAAPKPDEAAQAVAQTADPHQQAILREAVKNGFQTQEAIEIRSKGSDGLHMIVKSLKDGIWYCMCPTYKFKGGLREMKPCKHLVYCIVNGIGKPEDWFQYLV